MILCLDAGNSRIKWGVADAAGQWLASGALPTAQAGDLGAALAAAPRFERAIACSVAGEAVRSKITAAVAAHGAPLDWLDASAQACGVRNGYREPVRLGADRWAALIGAHALHAGPCVVVLAGTATTVDVLTADGAHRGGLILPGVDLMRGALARNTAQLPLAQAALVELPASTDEAIVAGCLYAQAGAVTRMYAHVAQDARACCLIDGGHADAILPALAVPARRVPHLVLEGLRVVAAELR